MYYTYSVATCIILCSYVYMYMYYCSCLACFSAEIGDYNPISHPHGYVSEFRFIQHQVIKWVWLAYNKLIICIKYAYTQYTHLLTPLHAMYM